MSTPLQVRILPLGDSALLVELGRAMDAVTHQRVRAAFEALEQAAIPGVFDLVPAYTSVAVHYDPLAFAAAGVPFDAARDRVLAVLSDVESTVPAPGRLIEIPVRYGGDAGPDLEHVARHTGMTARDVAALHASVEYTVSMTGFTPGFPYLSGLPPKLATPRRSSPRAAVAAGSVGIAGAQTGIYPLRSPGGWQIIGHTDVPLFRPDLNPPTLLRIGDRVRFVPAATE